MQVRDFLDIAADALGERGFHERVEAAVEHRVRIGALDTGAQVLDQLIRLQDVGADLVAAAISVFEAAAAVASRRLLDFRAMVLFRFAKRAEYGTERGRQAMAQKKAERIMAARQSACNVDALRL